MLAASYSMRSPWPARSATSPSSIVSVRGAAYENGLVASPMPLQALAQFISWVSPMRGWVGGTASASSLSSSG